MKNELNKAKIRMLRQISLCVISCIYSVSLFSQSFNRSELSTTLSTPWEIVYGPDNYIWITESGGTVSRVNPLDGSKTVIYTATDYFGGSPLEDSPTCPGRSIGSGTLGLALHPDFLNSNTSYIYYVYSFNNGTTSAPSTKFRIKRLLWNSTTETVIGDSNIVQLNSNGYDHHGGRLIAVKQDNISYLFLSIGDHGVSEDNSPGCYVPQSTNPNNFTQDVNTENGKIHRFNIDGSIPLDNPINGNSFYTRGHRNPQGLMYNSNLDIIYDIEHGDRTDDEINILHKGMNYGWKQVRGYHGDNNFAGEAAFISNYSPHPQIVNDSLVEPLFSWCNDLSPSSNYADWCTVAPSGGAYYGSDGIPQWHNSLLVVTLKDGASTDKELFQFKLQSNGKLAPSTLLNPNPKKFFGLDQSLNGRLRDIAISNDGKSIYLINNGGTSSDKITVYQYDSIASNSEPINIQLFPNPASDEITILGIEELTNLSKVKIFNAIGKQIEVKVKGDYTIDISHLAVGVHFIQLTYNSEIHTLKWVKN